MSTKIISPKTRENLEKLKKEELLTDFYLAGGTGLALQLKHRLSIDLDFFTQKEFNPERIIQKIKKLGSFSISKKEENSLTGNFEKTKISFLQYDYPLLASLKEKKGIKVADIKDIGCMKISAITSRGAKKDFIDLYFICNQTIALEELLLLFQKKYEEVDYNMSHILKSLIYFEDANEDPMPKMINSVSWKEVKSFFKKEIKNIKI